MPQALDPIRQPISWWRLVLLACTAALAGVGFWQQQSVDRRTAEAETGTAIVESHDGDVAVVLRRSGDRPVKVTVLAVSNYPLGSTVTVKHDSAGLLQPVATDPRALPSRPLTVSPRPVVLPALDRRPSSGGH